MKFYCVTPCLNAEKYIEETMLSVLTQTVFKEQNFFLFYTIRDGGSSDNTVEIIKRVINQFYNCKNIQVNYFSENDSGMYDALVKGFENGINSDVYSYINAGDYYSPHAFDIVSNIFINNSEVHFITGANCVYNEKGHLIRFKFSFDYNRNLLIKGFYDGTMFSFVQQESTFWDISVHKKIEYKKLRELKLAGDYYLWKTFISNTPLYTVAAWLGGFRLHESQLTSIFSDEYTAEMKSLSLTPTVFDYLLAYIHKIIGHLPGRIKKKLKTHTFEWDREHQRYRLMNKACIFNKLFH